MNFQEAFFGELEKIALQYKGIRFLPFGPRKGMPGTGHGDKIFSAVTAKHPRFKGVHGLAFPGRNLALISRHVKDRIARREVIAHEAFHNRNKLLGKFETLAYPYGAWKADRGGVLGALNASLAVPQGMFQDVRGLLRL